MFEQFFNKIQEKNKAIKVIGVWGKDGLELERAFYTEINEIDLEFSGAEVADIISKLDKTRISPETFYLKLDFYNHHLRIFSLTQDFFLMVISKEPIIDAKLNFYLNLYKDKLIASL